LPIDVLLGGANDELLLAHALGVGKLLDLLIKPLIEAKRHGHV